MPSKKLLSLGVSVKLPAASQDNKTQHPPNGEVTLNPKLDFILETVEGDSRPYLDVRIFGREVRALLDSGASRTIVGNGGEWILNDFPAKLRTTVSLFVETADAKKHAILGNVNLPITLQGRTKCMDVLYVPSLSHSLLLGIDFWEKFHIVADVCNKKWEFSCNSSVQCSAISGLMDEEHLTADQKSQLKKLIEDHFSGEQPALGRTDRVLHTIDTDDARAVKKRYYPLSPAMQQLVYKEVDNMLKLGVIEPSRSDWSSPLLLLEKPDGGTRVCVDFRALNAVTKKDAYPLPQVTTILDRLRDARYLSSLDIKSAFWQIPLDPACKEKTAFTVPGRGLLQFVTMPMGLCNAPATWQRFVDNVLGYDLEPYCFIYLDDIIVSTPSFEKHIAVLSEVMKRVKDAKVTLNRDKCHFCRSELRYLGYVVSAKGLRVDPEKVKSILDMPVPKNQKEVRQLCGTASWYRRFIPNFATRLYPLTSLLKKRSKFEWTKEAQDAYLDVKSCLVSSPILTCPDFTQPFIISCDASGFGLGAVLSQESDQGESVIAYASRTLSQQEQKYSATERECLAVIWAVERFRPYVEGSRFKVITDHYSLLWLNNLKDPQGRLARWALRLQPYDMELIHRKGQENVVPDMLSRTTPVEDKETLECAVVVPVEVKDKWYTKMLTNVNSQGQKYPQWRVFDHQLFKQVRDDKVLDDDERLTWKLVLPKDVRALALQECHDEMTAGHQGVFKTYKRLQQRYYWPKLRKDVATYVSRCKVCQAVKYDQKSPAGFMGERRGVDEPWKMISSDLMGPFPRSSNGFKYLLVVTDSFTKFCMLKPLRAATSKAVAKYLEEDIFLVYGVPKYLICDNGSEYIGSPLKNLVKAYQAKILYNPSRHPQSNPTERVNRNIITMLRAYIGENHREWDKNIAKIGFALRTAVHESTGLTPAFLTFAREPAASGEGVDVLHVEDFPVVEDCAEYGTRLQELNYIYKDVKQKLMEAHQKNSHYYNLRRRKQTFKVGDLVLKKNYVQSNAANYFAAKLAPIYVGPFKIAKKISELVYTLEDAQGVCIGNWHTSDLKKYVA